MRGYRTRRAAVAGMLIVAIAAAACSGGSGTKKTPTPASARTAPSATLPAATAAPATTPVALATVDGSSTAAAVPSSITGVRVCTSADIQARASEQGLPGSIGGSLILTNDSSTSCALTSAPGSGTPHLSLTDGTGAAIPVQQTLLSGDALSSVTLAAGQRTSVTFTWSNWCNAAPAAPISLTITLSGGAASAQIAGSDASADATPRCDDSSQPSVLSTSGFSAAQ